MDAIGQFFATLARPGHLATFEGGSATVRFDLTGDGAGPEHWHLTVADGDVQVSRGDDPADAVVTMRRADFDRVVAGRLNAQAAILRGLLTCSGSMAAVLMFQRCLPGPPGSTGRAERISGTTVMAQRRAS